MSGEDEEEEQSPVPVNPFLAEQQSTDADADSDTDADADADSEDDEYDADYDVEDDDAEDEAVAADVQAEGDDDVALLQHTQKKITDNEDVEDCDIDAIDDVDERYDGILSDDQVMQLNQVDAEFDEQESTKSDTEVGKKKKKAFFAIAGKLLGGVIKSVLKGGVKKLIKKAVSWNRARRVKRLTRRLRKGKWASCKKYCRSRSRRNRRKCSKCRRKKKRWSRRLRNVERRQKKAGQGRFKKNKDGTYKNPAAA